MEHSARSRGLQTAIGLGALGVAGVMLFGAWQIPSAAGYAGVGPDFLPWLVGLALAVCGVLLLVQARTGGFRDLEEPSGAARGDWPAFWWLSGGVLSNAVLIESAGFVLSCALCFALAVRGLRVAEGKPGGNLRVALQDWVTGVVIAAPVFWLFTKVLSVNLPGLTGTGWL